MICLGCCKLKYKKVKGKLCKNVVPILEKLLCRVPFVNGEIERLTFTDWLGSMSVIPNFNALSYSSCVLTWVDIRSWLFYLSGHWLWSKGRYESSIYCINYDLFKLSIHAFSWNIACLSTISDPKGILNMMQGRPTFGSLLAVGL